MSGSAPIERAYDLLILDYGGVYSFEYNPDGQKRVIYDLFGKDLTDAPKQELSDLTHKFDCGKINTQEYISQLSDLLDASIPPAVDQFERRWVEATLPPSRPMINLVKSIKTSGIKTALLSDMFAFEGEMARPWGRFNGFDKVFLSYKYGVSKKESAFFEKVLTHFSVAPMRTLFVDDSKKNTDTAFGVNIETLLADKKVFTSADVLALEIHQTLLLQ